MAVRGHRSANFNITPDGSHEEEIQAWTIIERLEKDGFSFKEIVVSAILKADGVTPAHLETSPGNAGVNWNKLQSMLDETFARFFEKPPSRGVEAREDTRPDKPQGRSQFVSNLLASVEDRDGDENDE